MPFNTRPSLNPFPEPICSINNFLKAAPYNGTLKMNILKGISQSIDKSIDKHLEK
jgi:hypothetical protein